MAIYLTDTNAAFIHIPKTGGTWVEAVLRQLQIAHEMISPDAEASTRHAVPAHLPGRFDFTFSFVRHPLAWYESWWKYQAGNWRQFEIGKWHPQRVLEPCASEDFSKFIRQCLLREPSYVSRMYEWYLGPPGYDFCDYVGRTETLAADLAEVLSTLGYEFNPTVIKRAPRIHVSQAKMGPTVWDAELKQQISHLEAPAIRRYYAHHPEHDPCPQTQRVTSIHHD